MPSLARVNKILALRRIKLKLEQKIILIDKKIIKEEKALKDWLKRCGVKRGIINSHLIEIRLSGKLKITPL